MRSLSDSAMEAYYWMPDPAVNLIPSAQACEILTSVIVGADARKAAHDGWPADRIVATDIVSGGRGTTSLPRLLHTKKFTHRVLGPGP